MVRNYTRCSLVRQSLKAITKSFSAKTRPNWELMMLFKNLSMMRRGHHALIIYSLDAFGISLSVPLMLSLHLGGFGVVVASFIT